MFFSRQSIGKPGSVVNDHLSSLIVAYKIKRVATYGRAALHVDLLAAGRVYLYAVSPRCTVSSYLTRFIFSRKGSFVSVALSLGSPPVAVSDCHCSILPGLSSYINASDRLMNCLVPLYPIDCLHVLVEGSIYHSVRQLIKLASNVRESHLLKLRH